MVSSYVHRAHVEHSVTVRVLASGHLPLGLKYKMSRIGGSHYDLLRGQAADGDLHHGATDPDHGLQRHNKLEIFLLRVRLALLPKMSVT